MCLRKDNNFSVVFGPFLVPVMMFYVLKYILVEAKSANINMFYIKVTGARGGVVVKTLRYKPTGRGFDSRWCQWNFSVT
jgi:hypothetical protein